MTTTTAASLVLAGAGVIAVAVDLATALRRHRRPLRTAIVATLAWTIAGLAFAAVVRELLDTSSARDYLTVFLLEKSLSLDNVAVFAVVLTAFHVPAARRQRVLVGGILAALVLRLLFVVVGLAAVDAVHELLVVFGVVLVVAGVRMVLRREADHEPPKAVQWLTRRRVNTAVAALIALALADVMFAVDSVPAAFAVTRDTFPIAAANLFAVLGLRPLYDLLAAAVDRLSQLERALGVLLALIGIALCVQPWWQVPEWLILTAVVATLGAGVALSLVPARRMLVSVGGGLLLLAGAAMLVLPGPGLLVIAAGLALLATEFVWARRLLERVKRRLPRRTKTDASK